MSAMLRSPIDAFRFCPRCGRAEVDIRQAFRLHCPACGLVLFVNSAAAVGAFVFYGHQLVLTVRGREPRRGFWQPPGGFVDFDETAEAALAREIREELAISVGDLAYLTSAPNDYLFEGVLYKTTDLFFVARTADIGGIEAREEVAGFVIVPPSAVDPNRFAFPSSRRAFETLLNSPLLGRYTQCC